MRIAHIADIHIRSKERHDEIKEATIELVKEIKKQKIDWLFVGGDIYHTKTNNITPELVDFLSWWLKTISEHVKVHMILGNHDGNLTNLERQDTITPIVNSINSPNIFLYKKSGVYPIDNQTNLCVFSLFDKEGWSKTIGEPGKINIGAFHGSVANCKLDNGWTLPEDKAEIKQSFFEERKLDFCLLGDIHLRQNIGFRLATGGQMKPYVAYPGSFRQNSFGESTDKGFLVWDIESNKKWNITYTSIPNSFPFINVVWNTDIKTTIESITEIDVSSLERLRLKIKSDKLISQTEKEQIQIYLSEKFKTFELVYDETFSKKNIDVSLQSGEKFTTNQVKFDTDTILKFYCEVNKKHNKLKDVVEEVSESEKKFVREKIEQYKIKIIDLLKEQVQESERWSIKTLEFDNLFKYGSDNIVDFEKLFGIVGLFGPNAIGKALSLKTEIPTTNGWKTIGSINVGDKIFTEKGKETTVVAKSPVYNNRVCYKVIFSDNTEVIADAEHLWTVEDHFSRAGGFNTNQTLTTRQLEKSLTWRKAPHVGYEWSINTCDAVDYSENELSIHPYVLGAWLGDGTSESSGFTSADNQIIENLRSFGEIVTKHNCKEKNTAYAIKMLAPRLRQMGVLNNKHIPENYMFSSIKSRKLLLAGLLDTDGYCSKETGVVEFSNTNKVLSEQVLELINSLGYKATLHVGDATLYGKFISKKYRITFTTSDKVFLLDRKNNNIKNLSKNSSVNKRFIISIVKTKREPVQCLVVDNPTHLFLVTRNFIATHNSSIIGAIAYTLFNDSDRGSVKNSFIVNNNKDRCKSKIVLEKGTKEYTVERETVKLIPKKQKNSSSANSTDKSLTRVNFSVRDLQTNIVTNLNGEEREETDKEIRKVFGTFEDFCLTTLSKQKGSSKFVDSGSTERKQILNKFLSLDVFEKYHKQANEELQTIDQQLKQFNNIEFETEKEKIQSRINQITFELEEAHKTKQGYETRLIELQAELLNLTNNSSYEQENALKSNINKSSGLVRQLEDRLNLSTKKLQSLQDSFKEKQQKIMLFEQVKQKISLDDLKQQLELHRTFDKELNELVSEHKYQNNKLEQQEKTVKKLSVVPCGDSFPTCMFIQDSHRDKHLIEDQKEKVQKIIEKIEILKRELDKIDPGKLQTQISNYESSLKKEVLLQAEILSNKKEIDSLNELLPVVQDSYNQEQSNLKNLMEKYNLLFGEGINKSIDAKLFFESEIKKQKTFILDKEKVISLLNRESSEMSIRLEQNEANKIKFDELKKLFYLQEKLTKSFSKTGIPSVVLKTQLPIINLEISKIIDPRFGFEIVLENNVSNNDMDVYLVDKSSARIIETCSGMEQTVASLAIRVALTNVSSLPKSDLFICDESLDGVDNKNRRLCLMLFSKLKDYFKTILLVSHVEEIKEIADKIIEIQEIQPTGEAYVCVN